MLRDELLKSKHDEIARCLSSRKRKLSELYFATVGFAGATGDAVPSLYEQKKQAFLDANDLSKGRYFNEATLPPLPDYAALIRRSLPQEKVTPADEVKAAIQDNAAVATAPLALDVSTVSRTQPAAAGVGPDQDEDAKLSNEQARVSAIEAARPTAADACGLQTSIEAPAKPSAVPAQPAPVHIASQGPGTRPSINGEVVKPAEIDTSASRKSQAVSSIEAREPSLPLQRQDKRLSVVVGPLSTIPEQPISPVSSVDPYSNNTPAPVPASPDTSPAEETIEPVDKLRSPRSDRERRPQAPPSLVPSTPDEQLRLEEAQSLQQRPFVPSETRGEIFQDEGRTLANEVAKEKVQPSQPAVSPPSGDAEKTTAQAQAHREELEKPDMKAPPREATTPVTPQPPSEPSPSSMGEGGQGILAAPPTVKKPQRTPSIQTTPQPERMTTRVSSGAIRHKSVSEILGETPKPATSPVDKVPESVTKSRLQDRRAKERERAKLATVVFPRPQPEKSDSTVLVRQNAGEIVAKLNEEQDYLFTLFQNKAYAPPRGTNLNALLASAHKTVTTTNHLVEYEEQNNCRTLRRIYALQNANRWPLRQLKRSPEPQRQHTHWDVVLDHAKWMRTDFREERKWKVAAAKSCADWCAEYVNSDANQRSMLRIRARIPARIAQGDDSQQLKLTPADAVDAMQGISHTTPELVASTEEESVSDGFNDELHPDLHDTIAPAAIFSLASDEFSFSLEMTSAAEKLLEELPIYAPVKIAPDTKVPTFKTFPDSRWKTELLPVSKYASGRITFHDEEPARKRSRYDFSQYGREIEHTINDLPPEQVNVALFRPENKQIRDRIHPGHSFRPPTEHPMPSVGFFESRQSSQWTYAEDDELRRLVKEYSYNWSLISSCLSSSSQFSSGAERRTPWECFERWIGLEGLPADLSKTQYFRAYSQRLETAQRTVLAQQQAAQQLQQQQQQQHGNNSQPQPPIRRRTTQPVRVDRRRSSKHLALLDAMRKLAKKRETILQKQQQASHLASLRKVNEVNQPKPPITTPGEFSRLKFEREMKLQERQEHYRQQMIAQQRASLAAQRGGQMPGQQPILNAQGVRVPNGVPQNSSNPGIPGNPPNGITAGLPPGAGISQIRQHQMQGMPAGIAVNGPMPPNAMAMKMMAQAGMQPAAGARPGIPMQTSPDNARIIREANRLQEQQQMLQSRQQHQQQQPQPQSAQQQFHNQQQFAPQGPHSPNLNMPPMNGAANSPAMIAAFQAAGGMQSPQFHSATPQGVSTPSPRMGHPSPLSSGVVPTISSIQSHIQRSNPNMSPEQVNKLATDRLHQYQQQRMSHVAMNAAAGNMGAVQANFHISHDGTFQAPAQSGMPNGGPAMQVPQAQGYSPMMRVAQSAQQNRVPLTSSPHLNGAILPQSRSVTPQTQRSGSAQAGPAPGSSKSPRAPQAQVATG